MLLLIDYAVALLPETASSFVVALPPDMHGICAAANSNSKTSFEGRAFSGFAWKNNADIIVRVAQLSASTTRGLALFSHPTDGNRARFYGLSYRNYPLLRYHVTRM